MVIVMDDEGRENEGDLLIAAEFVKPEHINFMAQKARGLICVPMEGKRLDELNLHPMKSEYLAKNHQHQSSNTGWAISVDAIHGVTTGISAYDRAKTVKVLIDPNSRPSDLSITVEIICTFSFFVFLRLLCVFEHNAKQHLFIIAVLHY